MNKAIVICYTGRQIQETEKAAIENIISNACDATQDLIITTQFDEDSIAKALLKKSAEGIVFDKENEQQQDVGTVKICFNHGPAKLQVLKFIKETFHLTLKDAKDAVDNGIIMVPRTTDVYQFVRDLYTNGGCIIDGGDEHYAVAQAAIFINDKYPGSLQARENLVKDFAMARYHDTVNATDNIEKALLNAVQIVKEHPDLAQQWINYDLVKTITIL